MFRLALVALLVAPPATAATSPLPVMEPMDPIGIGCIDGGGYDDPFPVSKGVRAPAFCLPEPCRAALSREELGRDILGRPAEDWEWDTYYSRYAEFCRAEAVVPRGSTPPVRTAEAFWTPIIAPPLQSYLPAGLSGPLSPATGPIMRGNGALPNGGTPIAGIPITGGGTLPGGGGGGPVPGGGPGSGGGTNPGGGTNHGGGINPSGGTTPGGGTTPEGGTTPGGGTNPEGGTNPGGGTTPGGGTNPGGGGGPDVPVVPLPTAGWLLGASLLALLGLRRRDRRSV